MNDFQKDLINLRKKIADALRAELLGPGSEVSYPDAEHELISEYPSDRYSVGILYPQDVKFGDNDFSIEGDANEPDEDLVTEDNASGEEDGDKQHLMYKDDAFNDDVNLAQQNKPSSMGLTFFVNGDPGKIEIEVEYAKYVVANDNDIIVPVPFDDLFIPDCLRQYISFNKKNKTVQKLQSIGWRELNKIFEQNAIEDRVLLNIIGNLNRIFKSKHAYRRCPINENIVLNFEKNIAKTTLGGAEGYVTAVKHQVSENFCSVTIMLVNSDLAGKGHLFQPQIKIESSKNPSMYFAEYNRFATDSQFDNDEKSLNLLYRKKVTYATGHGVSVDWDVDCNGHGCVRTEYIPYFEVPKIDLGLRRETEQEKSVNGKTLSMKYLSDLDDAERETKIADMEKYVDCYDSWIKNLEIEKNSLLGKYKETAEKHIAQCQESCSRMRSGLDILRNNDVAWKAFLLTNRAMFMQRIHSRFHSEDHFPDDQVWQEKLRSLNYGTESDANCYWRPFQLSFLLLSIRSIVDPTCCERDLVDLIWFPTGGGKTEAYLGLAAFTIFYRRLTNPNNAGTAVIMRYTLRLLTSQQFTRAATLICACEKIRRDEGRISPCRYQLGDEEISIGLWIGGDHVPNTNKSAKETLSKLINDGGDLKGRKDKFNKFQVLKCPWCGTKMVQEFKDGNLAGKWGYKFSKNRFYLSCTQESCEFEKKLPIQIIDEELYKNPPTLLFGTVDKFALMAWKKDVASFFGEGENDAPDLIIQDELHLIAGPLGSMVGIYETAIDYLCSRKGRRPKIVASTATIRDATHQCRALYNRDVRQFPAQGLDASDSFFAKEVPIEQDFGRMYLGVMPSGKTKVMLQARAAAIALQYVHQLKCSDDQKDQFYTLAIYFNSLKELGKGASVVADDAKDFIKRISYRQIVKQFSSRSIGTAYELTSRVSTTELNDTLDRLEHAEYSAENVLAKKYPINVLLASNMISVGVDVTRLNMMFLQGQPKSVSEYIQASSRIGRTNPGLAVTLYDASKSRDRSYYEQFIAFHSAFYKYVEPTVATPFSSPARDRALHAVLLSGARQSASELNADTSAPKILLDSNTNKVEKIAKFILDRVRKINSYNPVGMSDDSEEVRTELEEFVTYWKDKATLSPNLTYGDKYIFMDGNKSVNRLIKRFEDNGGDDAQRTLTSLRNVDKTVPVSVLIWEGEYED